jgi:hypothetical protein
MGVKVFTKDSINEALNFKSAADACRDELPIKVTTEYDEVAKIMAGGGKIAIAKAKAIMKATGIDEKCIQIFGLVCTKAQESNALEIIKEACASLWV